MLCNKQVHIVDWDGLSNASLGSLVSAISTSGEKEPRPFVLWCKSQVREDLGTRER